MAFKYGIELSTLILNIYKYIICIKKIHFQQVFIQIT